MNHTTHADAHFDENGLNKKEQAMFASIKRVIAQEGCVGREQVIRAVIESDGNLYPMLANPQNSPKLRRRALAKYRRFMDRSKNFRDAIAGMFVEFADFTPDEALRIHVQHIRGEAPENANYQALKDYEALVFPAQPKQVRIQQQTAIAHMSVSDLSPERVGPPPMQPRAIGSAKVNRDDA